MMQNIDLSSSFPKKSMLETNMSTEERKYFKTYYDESIFGFTLILRDLEQLPQGSRILEFGSGVGLLSHHLATCGFEVTNLEPSGEGFGMMAAMKSAVTRHYRVLEISKVDLDMKIENYRDSNKYDYIFSINVIEHLDMLEEGISSAIALLKPTGSLRLIAPNYAFPYEPHFNIPIFFNKKFTYFLFKNKIDHSSMFDPIGTWRSLNWVTAGKIKRIVKSKNQQIGFSRFSCDRYVIRARGSAEFKSRKGVTFSKFALISRFLLWIWPTKMLPILDCLITGQERKFNSI